MRIAVLVRSQSWGGAEVHSVKFAEYLARVGHEPVLACLGESTLGIFNEHMQSPLGATLVDEPTTSVGIRQIRGWKNSLEALRCDVAVRAKGALHAVSFPLELAARHCFQKFVTIEHIVPFAPPENGSSRIPSFSPWRVRLMLRGYARSLAPHSVVCVSEAVAAVLERHYGFPRRKLQVLRNGVDSDEFVRNDASGAVKRREWGVSENSFVFGCVGRLEDVKRLDLVLRAFAECISEHRASRATLLFVGEGAKKNALSRLSHELGISEYVHLVGFEPDVSAAYSAIDALVLASESEALPLVLLEAMASECLPIAVNVGGIPEVLTSKDLGWLVPPNDVGELAMSMKQVLCLDQATRSAIGTRVREHVKKNFRPEAQFSAIVDVLTNPLS